MSAPRLSATRRLSSLVGVLALAATALVVGLPSGTPADAAVPSAAGPQITITGSGWGHSVGMSQYGAREMARQGFVASDILGHYYQGTFVVPDSRTADDVVVRVNPFLNRIPAQTAIRVSSVDAGASLAVGGQVYDVPQGEGWLVIHDTNRRKYVVGDGRSVVGEQDDTSPVLVQAKQNGLYRIQNLGAGIDLYRHGFLEIASSSGSDPNLNPVIVQPMSLYLRGIAEVPSSWETQALEAQAIAARTYAGRIINGRVLPQGQWHLGATPLFQNYTGWAKEAEAGFGSRWVAAVDNTRGLAIRTGDQLAQTFYSSSHGLGRSESSQDSWAYSSPFPYLVSVDDPYSAGGGNPHATWTATASNRDLAGTMGLARVSNIAVETLTPGRSPKVLIVRGWTTDGRQIVCRWSGRGACPENDTGGKGAGSKLRTALPLTGGGAGGRLRSQQISGFSIAPFSDDESSIHQFNIAAIAADGITRGCTSAGTTFCPTQVVTRGQMATFIARATDRAPFTASDSFSDIAGSQDRGAINALARAGVVDGFPDGTFRPGDPVTREQMARFLRGGFGLPAAPGGDRFSDIGGSPFRADVNAIAADGITSGCGDGRYCPTRPVNREEMASFLARATGLGD